MCWEEEKRSCALLDPGSVGGRIDWKCGLPSWGRGKVLVFQVVWFGGTRGKGKENVTECLPSREHEEGRGDRKKERASAGLHALRRKEGK